MYGRGNNISTNRPLWIESKAATLFCKIEKKMYLCVRASWFPFRFYVCGLFLSGVLAATLPFILKGSTSFEEVQSVCKAGFEQSCQLMPGDPEYWKTIVKSQWAPAGK